MYLEFEYVVLSVISTIFILFMINKQNKNTVIKYPEPNIENYSDLYIDDNDICYRYVTLVE